MKRLFIGLALVVIMSLSAFSSAPQPVHADTGFSSPMIILASATTKGYVTCDSHYYHHVGDTSKHHFPNGESINTVSAEYRTTPALLAEYNPLVTVAWDVILPNGLILCIPYHRHYSGASLVLP